VRVTAGQAHPTVGRDEGIKWAVEGLTQAVNFAEAYPVKLAYENHTKAGVWQYLDFSHPTDIFLSIVEQTEEISLGVNWDTANVIAYGDDPIPVLRRIVDRIVSVHAADTSTCGQLKYVVLGAGIVPFRQMFQIIHNSGFDDWICIEEASFKGQVAVQAAANFVRKTWREVAEQ